jgi:hypothetical protein
LVLREGCEACGGNVGGWESSHGACGYSVMCQY